MKKTLVALIFLLTCSLGFAQLSGNYTINSSGTATASNYLSFTAAVSDLASGTRTDGGTPNGPAVNGAVTFTVSAGTYTEEVSIPAISGASATNTITFDGVDPSTRILTSAGTSSYDYTLQLNGADFIRINNLRVTNTGPTYGYAINLINQADNNEIKGCEIQCQVGVSSNYIVPVMVGSYYGQYANNASNLLIENNDITGGRYGIVYNGVSNNFTAGTDIIDNTITDAYYTGIRTYYIQQFTIQGNEISMFNGYDFSRGIEIYYSYDFTIDANKITNPGQYGMYFNYANTIGSQRALLSNNFIGGGFRTTSTAYGMYCRYFRNIDMVHNSINVDNNNGTSGRGVYMLTGCQGNDMRNNSIAYSGGGTGGYSYYITVSNAFNDMDNNNYYSNGTNLGYFMGTHAALSNLQAAFPTFNTNSQEQWPNYVSNTDLHTFGAVLANWADNSTSVTTDIDGDTRPSPPDIVKDVGADEFVLAPQDADLIAIAAPIVLAMGNNPVAVTVQNQGSLALSNPITIQFSTDGGSTWLLTESFNPTTLTNTGDTETFTFTSPWNVTVGGTYNTCFRINPPVTGDPDALDQICNTVCTSLTGNYTINPALPLSTTNYPSFSDAAAALNSCGIVGPVNFTVSPGTYNEFFELNSVNGTSATNTITFDGVSSAQCTLAQSFSSNNAALIKIDGTDYVTIKNMTLDMYGGTTGYGVHIANASNHNTVKKCEIRMDPLVTNAYLNGVIIGGTSYSVYGYHGNYNKVDSCQIYGGYYGVRLNGPTSLPYNTGNEITNCDIKNFIYTGIYSRYEANINFSGNHVVANLPGSTTGYGIYAYYADTNYTVNNNRIYMTGRYGMYIGYANQSGAGSGEIINNMAGSLFQTTSTAYALYTYNVKNADIYHNSLNNGWATGYAFYMSGSTTLGNGNDLKNNTFSNYSASASTGGAVYISDMNLIASSDYNNFYSTGGYFINIAGNNFTSLNWYNLAYSAHDQNSINVDPRHKSGTDLHVVCSELDSMGTPISGLTMDYDGQTRNATHPDIGADEFTSQSLSISLGPDTAHCGDLRLEVDSTFVNYIWSNGSFSDYSILDTTDTYWVNVVDTNNCLATDTINVIINEAPDEPFVLDSTFFCVGGVIDPGNDSTNSSFLWSDGDTARLATSDQTGWIWLEVTSVDGCTTRDSLFVDHYATPIVDLGNDTTFCLGGGTQLDAGANSPFQSYLWNTGASTQVIIVSAPGNYSVEVTSIDGCTKTDTVAVNALLPPVVNLGPDTIACDVAILDAGNPGASYAWNNGPTTQSQTVSTSGTYSVTVTNAAGCSNSDDVTISVVGSPQPNLGGNQSICVGGTATLDAGISGMNYFWSTGETTQMINVSTPGSYVVEVTDPATGCTGYDTVSVDVSPGNLNLGPDRDLCSGQGILLDAGSANSYTWSTGDNTRMITVTSPGTYTVTVVDNGCTATDTIVISSIPGVTAAISAPVAAPMSSTVNFTDQSTGGAIGWNWTFGDGAGSTQQNPTHSYSAMGTFTVTLVVNNGTCFDTTTTDITITAPVGIEEQLLTDGVNIYPNPNSGNFYLGFDLSQALDVEVEVIDLIGRVLYQSYLPNVVTRQEAVDLSGASSGLYLVRVRSGEGQIIRRVVIE